METILIFTIICAVMVWFLLIKDSQDAQKEPSKGTHIVYPDEEEVFSEFNEEDEHDPGNIF